MMCCTNRHIDSLG